MVKLQSKHVAFKALALVSVVFLAACESDEEKAASYFESGVELLEEGDVDRALIEFRNVFKLDPSHAEARERYAAAVRDQGRLQEAFGQYLRLVEFYPDNLEGRIALSELALQSSAFEEFSRHARAAGDIAPEEDRVKNLLVAVDYLEAVQEEDSAAQDEALTRAFERQDQNPDSIALNLVAIDGLMTEQKFSAAIEQIDIAIKDDPKRRSLYNTKLTALDALGETAAVISLLREMVDIFPQDEEIGSSLIRYLLSLGDLDGAEDFLRDMASRDDAELENRLVLVRFVEQTKGREAARAEVEAFIAEGKDTLRLQSLLAGYDFDDGKREEAIASLEALVADAEPSDARRRVQVLLARFLDTTDNEVGARAVIEEVLAQDPSMVQALEMRAAWLIEEDRADEAITALRQALDQEPEDVSAMTLMAQAHARNGNRALAGELLALASTTSNFAPAEALRYAAFLESDEKYLQAEEVLLNALRRAPNNTDILTQLGQTYVNLRDWPRAEQVVDSLRNSSDPVVTAAADTLQLRVLSGQRGADEAMAFLEQLATSDDGSALSANIALVRARAARGDFAGALDLVADLRAENPEVLALVVLDAAVEAAAGNTAQAETKYLEVLDVAPRAEDVWMQLIRLQNRTGQSDAASATLDRALTAIPGAPNLLWAKASFLEQSGDRTGALEVYEELYESNSGSPIIANNFASLMTQLDQSPETVDRAYQVARRLRGSEVPAFQDTYGWIAYLRGDYEEAISHLEGAAAGLPDDPVVQMHLGLTLVALERTDEARVQLQKAVDLAGAQRSGLVTKATEALAMLDSALESSDAN